MVTYTEWKPVKNTVQGVVEGSSRVVTYTEGKPVKRISVKGNMSTSSLLSNLSALVTYIVKAVPEPGPVEAVSEPGPTEAVSQSSHTEDVSQSGIENIVANEEQSDPGEACITVRYWEYCS